MNKIEYEEGKFLIYDNNPLKGRVVEEDSIKEEQTLLDKEIGELEKVYNDDKKLLEWAKLMYPIVSGLETVRDKKEKIDKDLSEISLVEEEDVNILR